MSKLEELADKPEDEARRLVLADLSVIRDAAMARTYVNKRGKEIVVPDVTAAAHITAVAAELAGVGPAKRSRGLGVADLSVFQGGQGPRKAAG